MRHSLQDVATIALINLLKRVQRKLSLWFATPIIDATDVYHPNYLFFRSRSLI